MPPPPTNGIRDVSPLSTSAQTQQRRKNLSNGVTTPPTSPAPATKPISPKYSPSAHSISQFPALVPHPSPSKSHLTSVADTTRPLSRSGSTPSPGPDTLHRPVTTVSGLRLQSPAPSHTTLSTLSATSSRASSRRPSVVTLQSFLEGVTHATRVRSPSLRGHSRRGSTEDGQALSPTDSLGRLSRGPSYQSLFADEDDFVIDDLDDGQPGVFLEGERLFVGARHQGHLVTAAALGTESGLKLEVIRKVGSGSYAVVYLARQILYDPLDDESYDPDDDLEDNPRNVVYGKEFALKCLCKTNLDEDLLQVQRFEVILHSSLPTHPNIVALVAAFETPAWLFLVMEYCPGQDVRRIAHKRPYVVSLTIFAQLFYWLEQAREHSGPSSQAMHPSASFESASNSDQGSSSEALYASTPRASTRIPAPLARQSDSTPPSPSILSATDNTSLLGRRRLRLISRMFEQMCEAVAACHGVGVSHRDIKPENFICSTDDSDRARRSDRRVVVKLTDWGLGSNEEECGDFDCGSKPYMAYECRNNLGPSYRPRPADIWSLGVVLLNLLFHRCPWSDPTMDDPDFVAFRADRVGFLSSRFEGIGPEVSAFLADRVFCEDPMQRVSAQEFGKWVGKLSRYTGGTTAHVSDAAVPMESTLVRPSLDASHRSSSTLASNRPSPRVSIGMAQAQEMAIAQNTPRAHADLPHELHQALQTHAPVPCGLQEMADMPNKEPPPVTPLVKRTQGSHGAAPPVITESAPTPPREPVEETEASIAAAAEARDSVPELPSATVPSMDEPDADAAALVAARHRRRKRGSRKVRPPATENGDKSQPNEHDALISDLAEATEDIARELSRGRSFEQGPTPSEAASAAKRPASGLMSRVRGAIMNGNPDLEAFRQRVQDRDSTAGQQSLVGTASAPAKLGQQVRSTDSTRSASSWASSSSWSDGPERPHWSSTSDRRTRLANHHSRGTVSSASPSPGRRSAMASLSATPLSSVSSVHSEDESTIHKGRAPYPVSEKAHVLPSPTPSNHSTLHPTNVEATKAGGGGKFGKLWRSLGSSSTT